MAETLERKRRELRVVEHDVVNAQIAEIDLAIGDIEAGRITAYELRRKREKAG